MKRQLIFLLLTSPCWAQAHTTVTVEEAQTITGAKTLVNPCAIDGLIYVSSGGCYPTPTAAFKAACGVSPVGATVIIPAGTWIGPTNWCSGLHVVGVGGEGYAAFLAASLAGFSSPPTTATTVLSYRGKSGLNLTSVRNLLVNNVVFDNSSANDIAPFTLTNVFSSEFDDVFFNCYPGTDATQPCLVLTGNGSDSGNTTHVVFNRWATRGGTWSVQLTGTGGTTTVSAATLDYFISGFMIYPLTGFIDFVQYCDSNGFENVHAIWNNNNVTGVLFNGSATPTGDVGVRTEWIHYIDFTGLAGSTNFKPIVVNASYGNFIQTGEITADSFASSMAGYAVLGATGIGGTAFPGNYVQVNLKARPFPTWQWSHIGGATTSDIPAYSVNRINLTGTSPSQIDWYASATGSPGTLTRSWQMVNDVNGNFSMINSGGTSDFVCSQFAYCTFQGIATRTRAVRTDTSPGGGDNFIEVSGNTTITLTPSNFPMGQLLTIKKTDSSATTTTISASSGNIDGQSSITLTQQNESITVQFDGTNFELIAAGGPVPFIIAEGTSKLASGSVSAASCAAAVTISARGTATTDTIEWSYASAPTTPDGLMVVHAYSTANNVNFLRCNPTAAGQTGTALAINWRVIR